VGTQANVESFYDQAKIFAFTSSSEGFPNVIAEALASGLPVVSYNCVAGPADLITDGENGFLVRQFDDESFCDRLTQLMADEEMRIRMSASARASISRLSPKSVASKMLDFMGCLDA
jgi:GalNAc-alpha-(1->4)-GalNAc-alpha-(1->3)-diNAcBac-PP-undecaprenol alpha-1,4-N-acetyl-D-galactosaminyltransferase